MLGQIVANFLIATKNGKLKIYFYLSPEKTGHLKKGAEFGALGKFEK